MFYQSSEVGLQQAEYKCPLEGVMMGEGEEGTSIACLSVSSLPEQPISLGNFIINWSR